MISDKLIRLGRIIKGAKLPERPVPACVNFCVHTEVIYDAKTYQALLGFCRDFLDLTGEKIAVCVATPVCPLIKEALSKTGLPEEEFISRLLEIAKFADIGYHGHFFRTDGSKLTQISRAAYDKDLVTGQIKGEMAWLRAAGLNPVMYIAGWWFMTEDIVSELSRQGIKVDFSIRKGKPDTFGTKYLNDGMIPYAGKPFMLPPSKDIVEIQSVFGPVMTPPIMKSHLAGYISGHVEEGLFLIFPLHDWDIASYRRNIWSNVEALTKSKDAVTWASIPEMTELCLKTLISNRR